MNRSKEVTALRKGGMLDEAYLLASELVANPKADEWERSAYGWCLIDLVKKHAGDSDQTNLREYLSLLSAFQVPRGNDLLIEHRERTLTLADDDRRAVMKARKLGKDGRHEDAIRVFSALSSKGVLTREDKISLGWELFRAVQAILKAAAGEDISGSAVDAAKRHLNTYFKLGMSEAGLLHSCFLQQAVRLSGSDQLRLVVFARLWNLDLLRPEDFTETKSEDGKVYQPLAEAVFQRASKEAAAGGSQMEMQYILPYLEDGLKRFPENVWLKLNQVKLLRGMQRLDEAWALAIDFARGKASEYWTWELVGDLATAPAMRLACYAKALSCSDDDKFVTKVRLKFASLIALDNPGHARYEVERVIAHRERHGERVPADARDLATREWFRTAISEKSDVRFYDRFKSPAEDLLFAHLPWTDATVGDEFIIPGKDGQKDRPRRRIYLKADKLAVEIHVTAAHPDIRRLSPGSPIKVQVETPENEPWRTNIRRIQVRNDGKTGDVITPFVGVIDHVNTAKGVFHFIVDKDIGGTFPLADYALVPAVGSSVAISMVRYSSKHGWQNRILAASPTDQPPSETVMKSFREDIEVRNELGFTSSGIFIPANLVSSADIADGDTVEGLAVLSFDKRRERWGFKAIVASAFQVQ